MWSPKTVGVVIAERKCEFLFPKVRNRKISISFGRPVRGRSSPAGDPWWCPVQISGGGFERFETVAGEDSLQALLLAIAFVERSLVQDAKDRGGSIVAYGVDSPALCHSTLSFATRTARKKKKPNLQTPEPKAPSGRGSL